MTAFIRLVSLKIDMSVVCTLPRQFLVSKKYNANILQYRSQNMHNLYQTTINVLPYLQRSLHADASTSELIYIYIYTIVDPRPSSRDSYMYSVCILNTCILTPTHT